MNDFSFTINFQMVKVRLVRDIVTNFSKGYAFIEYESHQDAKEAIKRMNHAVIDDKSIIVMWECERELPNWVPRRLGGGFGGKKESGQLRFGGEEKPWKRPFVAPSLERKVAPGVLEGFVKEGRDGRNHRGTDDDHARRKSRENVREARKRDRDYKDDQRYGRYDRWNSAHDKKDKYGWGSKRRQEANAEERKHKYEESRKEHGRVDDSSIKERYRDKGNSRGDERNTLREIPPKEKHCSIKKRDSSENRQTSHSRDKNSSHKKLKKEKKEMKKKKVKHEKKIERSHKKKKKENKPEAQKKTNKSEEKCSGKTDGESTSAS